ncbi:MAG: hypothetical protein WA771_11270 [Chthoniobacterales bacterium]
MKPELPAATDRAPAFPRRVRAHPDRPVSRRALRRSREHSNVADRDSFLAGGYKFRLDYATLTAPDDFAVTATVVPEPAEKGDARRRLPARLRDLRTASGPTPVITSAR